MTESEAFELGNKLYSNITSNANNIIKTNDYIEFVRMAINALEKQIPKKPRFYAHNYYCSVCDSLVGNNEFEWKRFKYCDNCGQKLDWSDEDE